MTSRLRDQQCNEIHGDKEQYYRRTRHMAALALDPKIPQVGVLVKIPVVISVSAAVQGPDGCTRLASCELARLLR